MAVCAGLCSVFELVTEGGLCLWCGLCRFFTPLRGQQDAAQPNPAAAAATGTGLAGDAAAAAVDGTASVAAGAAAGVTSHEIEDADFDEDQAAGAPGQQSETLAELYMEDLMHDAQQAAAEAGESSEYASMDEEVFASEGQETPYDEDDMEEELLEEDDQQGTTGPHHTITWSQAFDTMMQAYAVAHPPQQHHHQQAATAAALDDHPHNQQQQQQEATEAMSQQQQQESAEFMLQQPATAGSTGVQGAAEAPSVRAGCPQHTIPASSSSEGRQGQQRGSPGVQVWPAPACLQEADHGTGQCHMLLRVPLSVGPRCGNITVLKLISCDNKMDEYDDPSEEPNIDVQYVALRGAAVTINDDHTGLQLL